MKSVVGIVGSYAHLREKDGTKESSCYVVGEAARRVLTELEVATVAIMPPRNLTAESVRDRRGVSYELAKRQLSCCNGLFFENALNMTSFATALVLLAHQMKLPTLGVGNALATFGMAFGAKVLSLNERPPHDYVMKVKPDTRLHEILQVESLAVHSHSGVVMAHPSDKQVRAAAHDCHHEIEVLEATDPELPFFMALRFQPDWRKPEMERLLDTFLAAL